MHYLKGKTNHSRIRMVCFPLLRCRGDTFETRKDRRGNRTDGGIVIYVNAESGRKYSFEEVRETSVLFGKGLRRKWGWKKNDVRSDHPPPLHDLLENPSQFCSDEQILTAKPGSSTLRPKLYRHTHRHLGLPLGRRHRQPRKPSIQCSRIGPPSIRFWGQSTVYAIAFIRCCAESLFRSRYPER